MHETIETLLDQLTLEEKVSLLAGASWWRTVRSICVQRAAIYSTSHADTATNCL
jgi:hypothetical protein